MQAFPTWYGFPAGSKLIAGVRPPLAPIQCHGEAVVGLEHVREHSVVFEHITYGWILSLGALSYLLLCSVVECSAPRSDTTSTPYSRRDRHDKRGALDACDVGVVG